MQSLKHWEILEYANGHKCNQLFQIVTWLPESISHLLNYTPDFWKKLFDVGCRWAYWINRVGAEPWPMAPSQDPGSIYCLWTGSVQHSSPAQEAACISKWQQQGQKLHLTPDFRFRSWSAFCLGLTALGFLLGFVTSVPAPPGSPEARWAALHQLQCLGTAKPKFHSSLCLGDLRFHFPPPANLPGELSAFCTEC